MQIDAIIVAAGSSQRFGEGDKLTAALAGRPVVGWSLAAHDAARTVGRVLVVCQAGRIAEFEAMGRMWAPRSFAGAVPGGDRRRDSVEAGMRAAASEYVSLHDGARPLVTGPLIDRCVLTAVMHDGATAASPLADTIKEIEGDEVSGHLDRSRLRAVQTPQVVRREDWLAAAALSAEDETDDTAMVARLGLRARLVESVAPNLKITTAADLAVAEALLRGRRR